MTNTADVIVVGAGLAGLVAAAELADAGRRVILVDQEPEQSLGGQAFWSFGGLFLVGSPEQKRLRIRDDLELATADWMGSAGFDRPEDHWPRQWAHAYLDFRRGGEAVVAARAGRAVLPGGAVGRAGRIPGRRPRQLRAAVPCRLGHRSRVWSNRSPVGSGRPSSAAVVRLRFRHRVTSLVVDAGAVTGVRGEILAPSDVARGARVNPGGSGRLRAERRRGDRHLRRHRCQSRPGAGGLARGLRRGAASG